MSFEKAFSTKAFDLTPSEKHASLGEVKSLLLLVGSRIQHAVKYGASRADWIEMFDLVSKAKILAQDPDACDAALAPLASCYLYEGHILLELGEREKAYEAYEKAATSEAHALTDFPAVKKAAEALLELKNKPAQTREMTPLTPNSRSHDNGDRREGRPDSLFLSVGIDESQLPVIVRPGPAKERLYEVSGPSTVQGSHMSSGNRPRR